MLVSMTTSDRPGPFTSVLKMMPLNSPNRSLSLSHTHTHTHTLTPSQVAVCKALMAGNSVTLIKQDLVIGEGPV